MERFLVHILPLSKFRIISRPVIRTVWYSVIRSKVEKSESANPKGSIGGIHPITYKLAQSWRRTSPVEILKSYPEPIPMPNNPRAFYTVLPTPVSDDVRFP